MKTEWQLLEAVSVCLLCVAFGEFLDWLIPTKLSTGMFASGVMFGKYMSQRFS